MTTLSPNQIGFSTASLAGYSLAEACHFAHEHGFRAIELLAFGGYRHSQGVLDGFYFERLTADEREHLRDLVSGFERVSTHAPFFEVPLLSPNPALREAAQGQLEIAIEAIAFLGGQLTVTHAAPKGTYSTEDSWDELVALYRRLGDLAGERGVRVTIETTFPPSVEQFAQLIHDIDHPHVGANVDVGHLTSEVPADVRATEAAADYYNDLLEAHLRSLAGKLFHFHLHDVRQGDLRDHRACGRGVIDYTRLLRVAAELDYDGAYIIEIEEPDLMEAVLESRRTLQAALPTRG